MSVTLLDIFDKEYNTHLEWMLKEKRESEERNKNVTYHKTLDRHLECENKNDYNHVTPKYRKCIEDLYKLLYFIVFLEF